MIYDLSCCARFAVLFLITVAGAGRVVSFENGTRTRLVSSAQAVDDHGSADNSALTFGQIVLEVIQWHIGQADGLRPGQIARSGEGMELKGCERE